MIDLAPTFAAIAGTDLPIPSDGRSLLPLLEGEEPSPPWRQAQLMEHWSVPVQHWTAPEAVDVPLGPTHPQTTDPCANTATPKWKGVRTADYKFIEQYSITRDELYDLESDPYELQSLVDAIKPEFLSQLTPWIEAYYACSGPACDVAGGMQPPTMQLKCYDPDGNGRVDIVDIQAVTARWNLTAADPGYDPRYDPSGDGLISSLDFTLVARGWRQPCSD